MQEKPIKRLVSGVLLLNKHSGCTSNQALQRAKRLYMAAKAGHTGNLDPFATGLLPICFGEATKFAQTLLEADKVYRAVLKFGITTSTGDTEGQVTGQNEVDLTGDLVEAAVKTFLGDIWQIPPMHSALKFQGKPLYQYARAGKEIERKPRQVRIFSISLERFQGDIAEILVRCSKGTYIRVLAEDIGRKLGCGAHLVALQRLGTAGFKLDDAYTIGELEAVTTEQRDRYLLPVDALLNNLPKITLDEDSEKQFLYGKSVAGEVANGRETSLKLRVYGRDGAFLGLCEAREGFLKPIRLMSTKKAAQ